MLKITSFVLLLLVTMLSADEYYLSLKGSSTIHHGTATVADSSVTFVAGDIPWLATTPAGSVVGYSDSTVAYSDGSDGILQDTIPVYVHHALSNVITDSGFVYVNIYPKFVLFNIADTTVKVYEQETIIFKPTVTPAP